jgi:hypothetical protein
MTALRGWCTSPSVATNPPFPSRQAQLESGVRGNVPAPFGAGERLQSPTYRYPAPTLDMVMNSSRKPCCCTWDSLPAFVPCSLCAAREVKEYHITLSFAQMEHQVRRALCQPFVELDWELQ